MRGNAFGAGFGEVVRQQQDAVRAETLGLLREGDRLTRRAARAGDDRHLAATGLDGGGNHVAILAAGERKEFAGAARCKERGRAERREPFEPCGI